ncbi:MAG: hypothetical protein D6E12_01570 [Desulfovibrio sp.]|nr:MAG: hypothetical protein D6E12_01570 [Desulfovibrio sp.]
MSLALLIILSIVEVLLLGALALFFLRLRRSEELLQELQSRQDDFLARLRFNAELEDELMASFGERQNQLARLGHSLDSRIAELTRLVDKAERMSQSPAVLRRMILDGHRQGKSNRQLAKATGLALDEVELILTEAKP